MARIFGSSEEWSPEESTCSIELERVKHGQGGWGVDVGTGPRSLKVACLSDTHGRYRGMEGDLQGADLVIFAGDLLDFRQRDAASLADMNAWIADLHMKKEQILFVAGNHDSALCNAGKNFDERAAAVPGTTYIEGNMVTVADGNVTVAGGPWVLARPFYYFSQNFALSGSNLLNEWHKLTSLVLSSTGKSAQPKPVRPSLQRSEPPPTTPATEPGVDESYLDILLTHGPPEGVFDIDYKQRRTGTVTLRDVCLAKVRPKVHIFGHNHDQFGTVWGTVHQHSKRSDFNTSDHRVLFVGAAATFTHVCQYFTLHY